MPQHSRGYSGDEEIALKRDDDFKPAPRRTASWPTLTIYLRPPWRRKRFLVLLAALAFIYVFVKNIPIGLGPMDWRLGTPLRPGRTPLSSVPVEPSGAPPRPEQDEMEAEGRDRHYYAGPIKLYRLANSLHGISRTMGHRMVNRNVLFAVSSLKSASNLMPMACEMARLDSNNVHFVLLGRDSLPLEDVLQVNGVDKKGCDVDFHDGRPDYSEWSTDARAEFSVAGALNHVKEFMHPQIVIMDDSLVEDMFFVKAMRAKAKEWGTAIIEIPAGGYEDFLWITRLDSGSLASWHKPRIDVLVHAPPGSSGSLIRMIKSLQEADYSGLIPPRLTIELPPDVEPFLQRYLQYLVWPPIKDGAPPHQESGLTLRHRIPTAHLTSEAASLRFLESFYPANQENEHILILSPQAELSSVYMQYLLYTILEYRYSSYGSPLSDKLMGVALDVPSTYLDSTGNFKAPTIANMTARKYTNDDDLDQDSPAPFLYNAPSSAATLYFGDKWTEIHDFLSNRIAATHNNNIKSTRNKKVVSEIEPAWIEYLLELTRARGYSILHPSTSLVTLHNELAQLPEEFLHNQASVPDGADAAKGSDNQSEEPYLTADTSPAIVPHIELDRLGNTQPLHALLPFSGDLPELPHLPFLSHAGTLTPHPLVEDLAQTYAAEFRVGVGGCSAEDAARLRKVHDGRAGDLFCLTGLGVEYDIEAEERVERDRATAGALVGAGAPGVDGDEDDGKTDGEDGTHTATTSAKAQPSTTKPATAALDRATDVRVEDRAAKKADTVEEQWSYAATARAAARARATAAASGSVNAAMPAAAILDGGAEVRGRDPAMRTDDTVVEEEGSYAATARAAARARATAPAKAGGEPDKARE